MAKAPLTKIESYCNRLLRLREINDYEAALNGLQVENGGTVTRIAAAVDASLSTAQLAVAGGANLLVVHHGLFWSQRRPWTGSNYRLMRFLLEHDVAVYSAHLPLDVHPELGNNAQLCRALGFRSLRPFFFEKKQFIGLQTKTSVHRDELVKRLVKTIDSRVTLIPGGEPVCRKIGVVTGGAGSHLKTAAAEGIDTFITGEGPHWTHSQAEELGVNVLYGGHYATETFGVKSLARHLSRRFGVPWIFLDHPSGL
jgi:dinuclear metal center YbgI/SA1388 family protein